MEGKKVLNKIKKLKPTNENTKIKDPVLLPKPSPTKSLSEEGLQDLSLAKQHYFGRGSNLDLKRAFQLFSQSASSGNPEAARYLGIMYLRGKGVEKDSRKALEWFTKAAAGGDELAKKNVKALQILSSRN